MHTKDVDIAKKRNLSARSVVVTDETVKSTLSEQVTEDPIGGYDFLVVAAGNVSGGALAFGLGHGHLGRSHRQGEGKDSGDGGDLHYDVGSWILWL